MKLKMHGFYDKITDHLWHEGDTEPYIDCYDDSAILTANTPKEKSIALMIEPRSITPKGYAAIENGYWAHFKYVFTHDSKLLAEIPNARYLEVGAVWSYSDEPKTKFCSLCCSFKEMCELHMIRKELAYEFENSGIVDVYGDYKGRGSASWVDCSEYLKDYRFSIIIENYIDDNYFTEKILNCFAHKVLPVYWGARDIDKHFDKYGIFHVNSKSDIKEFVKIMSNSPGFGEIYYENVRESIEKNYRKVKAYSRVENWLFDTYGESLERMK